MRESLSVSATRSAMVRVEAGRTEAISGTSRIALGAAQLGILGDVLDAIRSYQRS